MASDFNRTILGDVAHRPWPMPDAPWVMTQTWHDLLFAHWRVDVAEIRRKVPSAFALDLCDGDAWVGVVPFRMSNVAPRGVASLPWISAFPELNVRTYVRVNDRPGVYFFSLDAGRAVAAWTARLLLNLPYFTAAMEIVATRDQVNFRSRRVRRSVAKFEGSYRPAGSVYSAPKGSLEHFLTERYCLFHQHRSGARTSWTFIILPGRCSRPRPRYGVTR